MMKMSQPRMVLGFEVRSCPCPPMVTVLFIVCKFWLIHGLVIIY